MPRKPRLITRKGKKRPSRRLSNESEVVTQSQVSAISNTQRTASSDVADVTLFPLPAAKRISRIVPSPGPLRRSRRLQSCSNGGEEEVDVATASTSKIARRGNFLEVMDIDVGDEVQVPVPEVLAGPLMSRDTVDQNVPAVPPGKTYFFLMLAFLLLSSKFCTTFFLSVNAEVLLSAEHMAQEVEAELNLPEAAEAAHVNNDEENHQRDWLDNLLSQNSGILSPLVDDDGNVRLNVNAEQQPQPPSQQDYDGAIDVDVDDDREDLERLRAEAIAEIEVVRGRHNQLGTYLMATRHEDVEPLSLGEFTFFCEYCGAQYFRDEINTRGRYTRCCFGGKVVLPALQPLPDVLDGLYRDMHPQSRAFMRAILKYNNAFQFASTQATLRTPPPGRGPMVYSIKGKIYHHLGNVVVPEPQNAKYGTVYFLETDNAVDRRRELHHDLNEPLLRLLERVLREHNPFARGR